MVPKDLKSRLDKFFLLQEVSDSLTKPIPKYLSEEKDWRSFYIEQEKKASLLFKKYKILNLAENQEIKNTYVLASEKLWPNFVIKIPRPRRINETLETIKFRSLYQNISRIFYNNEIKKLTNINLVKHIYQLKKFLYHIPGRPKKLCDNNYFVVSEKINSLPTTEENKKKFQDMIDKEKNSIKREYAPFINDIITAIVNIGLGDIAPQNIFFSNSHQSRCIFFVDTEQCAKCNKYDTIFFNKNDSEINLNKHYGLFNFFVRFFNISEKYSNFLVNKILSQKNKFIKKQYYSLPKNLIRQ